MARGLLGPSHPLQMRHARRNALRESDCVLLAGVPCDFRLDYGRHVRRSATLIAANRSAKDARLNRRPTIAAIGDAGLTLEALARASVSVRAVRSGSTQLRARDDVREREIDEQASKAGEHVNPIAFFRTIDRVAGEHAVMVADGGDFVATASYILRPRATAGVARPRCLRHARRRRRFCARRAARAPAGRGLADLGRRCQRLRPDGVRHFRATSASPSSLSSATTPAGRRSRASRSRCWMTTWRRRWRAATTTRWCEGFGAEGLVIRHAAEVEPVLRQAREIARSGRPVLVNVWLDRTDFREGSISM